MPRPRTTLIGILAITILTLLIYTENIQQPSWEDLSQNVGMGEWTAKYGERSILATRPKVVFRAGRLKPVGFNYTKKVVVPKMKGVEAEWLNTEIPDVEKAIYVPDDPRAPLHPPKNKGHEVMIYLTYIIDHYHDLPDVSIFMHSHQEAWHNAELMGNNAAEMVNRLSPERVIREGYMSMRCDWEPGCPDWMHPGETNEDISRPEEVLIAKAWAELFPLEPVPDLLASPCCAQFAVSQDRILSIPLSTFIFYRDWLLRTPLKDFVSGRVWEYLWQYVFTGSAFFCPKEHVCYCDGYGICFGGHDQFKEWYELKKVRDDTNTEWLAWEEKGRNIEAALDEGRTDDAEKLPKPEEGKNVEYEGKIRGFQERMDSLLEEAKKRGKNAEARAKEAGRNWRIGDGF
ncbi:MAG: hypothetical protein M1828_006243 [Chrysothrix sp. TS-e1954]|nr:MAG: hypothetical protein M1828_006243 [Chrysothrix sp. TS-e1954]